MAENQSFVLTNITAATMVAGDSPYGLLVDAAIAVQDGSLSYVGPGQTLPDEMKAWPVQDGKGALVTPALIDCHTHLIYGGDRAAEFEQRLNGVSYQEIARAGGGIASTVKATRDASEDALLESALQRTEHFIAEGVGTIEIKSGYGLDLETELKMLRTARRIEEHKPVHIITTLLAAHAIPAEYKNDPEAYIDRVCDEILPAAVAEGVVDAVDAFCETIAFSPSQVARVFQSADKWGLPVKLHAEQISNLGGAALAAGFEALSADHLEYLDDAGVMAMAKAGTVAVVLPGAFYTLRETRLPPIDLLRQAGVPMAVATDCNPGSSPLFSPLLAMNMACTLFRLMPEEALAGMTREAARALGLLESRGTLEVGKRADLALWRVDRPAELSYHIGYNPLIRLIHGGAG